MIDWCFVYMWSSNLQHLGIHLNSHDATLKVNAQLVYEGLEAPFKQLIQLSLNATNKVMFV